MKRGTTTHSKMWQLGALLGQPHHVGVGLLTILWEMAAQSCPAGDIGMMSDAAIARAVDWRGEPADLVQALVAARWLDRVEGPARLVIHGWAEHCEDGVHRTLAKRGEYFWDGEPPRDTRLGADERRDMAARYAARWGAQWRMGRPDSAYRVRMEKEAQVAQSQAGAGEAGQQEALLPDGSADVRVSALPSDGQRPALTNALTNALKPPPGAEPPSPPPQPEASPGARPKGGVVRATPGQRASARAALGSAWRAATTAAAAHWNEGELAAGELDRWQPRRAEANTLHVDAPSPWHARWLESNPQLHRMLAVELGGHVAGVNAVAVHVADAARPGRRRGGARRDAAVERER